MREVQAAAQDCQVAVARLVDTTRYGGVVAEAATRSLHGLALDVHHECRRLRANPGPHDIGASVRRPTLSEWLYSPVDSGEPVHGDAARLRRTHVGTMLFRLAAALGAAVALTADAPQLATALLAASVIATGTIRYQTNAESASTFRARYLSGFCGYVGDISILIASAIWLYSAHPGGWFVLPLGMVGLHLLGVVAQTGALLGGVFVPRLRLERVTRLAAMCVGLGVTSIGYPQGFIVALAIMFVWFWIEAVRSFRLVWAAGATEIAWTARTETGFRSNVLTAPHPGQASRVPSGIAPPA